MPSISVKKDRIVSNGNTIMFDELCFLDGGVIKNLQGDVIIDTTDDRSVISFERISVGTEQDTYRLERVNGETFDVNINKGREVINNLNSDDENLPVAAKQAKVLNNKIDAFKAESEEVFKNIVNPVASSVMLSGNVSLEESLVTKNFAVVTYTGNGSTKNITSGINSVDFTVANNGSGYWLDRSVNQVKNDAGTVVDSGTCDWGTNKGVSKIHIKSRSNAYYNLVYDGVRGINKNISTNVINTEENFGSRLTVFNTNGFTVGADAIVNGSGVTYVAYQTLYTHIKWGTTNHGKFYVEAYNPITREGMIYYIGSGLSGHEIPHSMGVEIDWLTNKNLTQASHWSAQAYPANAHLHLNLTNALDGYNDNSHVGLSNNVYITVNTSLPANISGNEHISYYKCKSETFTIGTYTGTGEVGNFIETKDINGVARKPARIAIKSINVTGNWQVFDNKRGSDFDGTFTYNMSDSEANVEYLDVVFSGFTMTSTALNTSGGQYLYLIEFDTNSDGGDSYFDYPTDDTNLNITNGVFTFTDGIIDNGYNVSTESFTGFVDFAGVSNGIKYIGRTKGTSWRFEDKKPSFGMYEKESADDNRLVMIDGVWYETTGGVIYENDGSSNTGIWVNSTGNTVLATGDALHFSWSSNVSTLYSNVLIDGLEVGKEYIVEGYCSTSSDIIIASLLINPSSSYGTTVYTNSGYDVTTTNDGYIQTKFTAFETSMTLSFRCYGNTGGEVWANFDNISVYKLEPTLGTPVTTPISFLPKPYKVVSETPQAEMSEFDALPSVVGEKAQFEEITVNGKLRPKGGMEVYVVDDNYIDIDAIGANPQATLWSDGTVTGSTDNGSYTKYPNGDLECRNDNFLLDTYVGGYDLKKEWLFPIEFVDTSYTHISRMTMLPSGLTDEQRTKVLLREMTKTNYSVYENLWGYNTFTNGDYVYLSCYAKGRWK